MTTTGSWRDTAITDSNLPPRAIRVLTAAGFSDLGSLDDATDIELIRTRDLGRMQMANVRKMIETHRRGEIEDPDNAACDEGHVTSVVPPANGLIRYLRDLEDLLRPKFTERQWAEMFVTMDAPSDFADKLCTCVSLRTGDERKKR